MTMKNFPSIFLITHAKVFNAGAPPPHTHTHTHPKKKGPEFRNLTVENSLPSPTILEKPIIPSLMRNCLYFAHRYNATWHYGPFIHQSERDVCRPYYCSLVPIIPTIFFASLSPMRTSPRTKFKETALSCSVAEVDQFLDINIQKWRLGAKTLETLLAKTKPGSKSRNETKRLPTYQTAAQ